MEYLISNSNNNLQGAIKLLLSVLLICSSGSLVVFSKGHKVDGLPRWFSGKESACQCRSLIPGSGRYPGRGNGNPLQYPCLGNPMDRGAWWGVMEESTRSQRETTERLSTHAWSYSWNAQSWQLVEPSSDLTSDVCLQSSAPLPWDSQQLGRGGHSLPGPWEPDEVRSARG